MCSLPAGGAHASLDHDIASVVCQRDQAGSSSSCRQHSQVTFRIHAGLHNGESVYYIRTDTSDPPMAAAGGLLYGLLLNVAQTMANVNVMYTFADGRPAVVKWIPGDENYSSRFRHTPVTVGEEDLELASVEASEQALQEGRVTATQQPVFVHFPFVQWPGGGLSVDSALKEVLAVGHDPSFDDDRRGRGHNRQSIASPV